MADEEFVDGEDGGEDSRQGDETGEYATDTIEGGADESMIDGDHAESASGDGPAAAETKGNGTAAEDSSKQSGARVNSREDDERKIFVGGLHWETTENDLKQYFSKFGKVVDCTLKMDQNTGKSRGFGFVLFEDVSCVDKVVEDKSHNLNGRTIDAKRALARGGGANAKAEPIKKIFVGGLSPDMPESEIREYFSQYGKIEDVELPFDKLKNQRRAFIFITYDSEQCVEKAVAQSKQKLGDKEVDVRKATPKSDQDGYSGRGRGGMRGGPAGRGTPGGGYYGGYAPPAYGGYDYSAYYGQQPYAYGAYPGYGAAPGYDYSAYYGQDWSQYQQGGYAYPGYDYSGYYGAAADPSAAGAAGAYKAKRGGTGTGASGYHPYSR